MSQRCHPVTLPLCYKTLYGETSDILWLVPNIFSDSFHGSYVAPFLTSVFIFLPILCFPTQLLQRLYLTSSGIRMFFYSIYTSRLFTIALRNLQTGSSSIHLSLLRLSKLQYVLILGLQLSVCHKVIKNHWMS